jgi:hypothetical protein
MEQARIDELVAKYNEGVADPAEIQQIESLLEGGIIELTQLHSLTAFDEQLAKAETPAPSLRMDDQFYAMLAKARKDSKAKGFFSLKEIDFGWLSPRLAFGVLVLVVGFAGGYMFQKPATSDVATLTGEVQQLKEMMMLSLLEKESATERLRAVSLTNDMDQVSQAVTTALFKTLNSDESVNVRLAALEALTPYSKQPAVREELIRSIGKQESPLVQVAMAELMAAVQAKKSVKELQKIIDSEKTPTDAKNRIKESMKVLI